MKCLILSRGGVKSTSISEHLPNLDILKYICAMLVVFYHTANLQVYEQELLGEWENIIWSVARFVSPVECFFVVSAYLLFRKVIVAENKDIHQIVKRYIIRLAILYLIWSIPYFPSIVRNFQGRSLIHNVASFIRQYFITGYSLQTWYMPALIFGTLAVLILFETIKNNKFLVAIFILGTIVLFWGTSYYYLLPQNKVIEILLKTGLISWMRSVPFVFIGLYIASKADNGSLRSHKGDFLWWAFFGIGSLLEIKVLKGNKFAISNDFYVCMCPTVYFLIKGCIVRKQLNVSTKIIRVLGKMSTIIYFSHVAVRDLIIAVWKNIVQCVDLNGFVLWVMTFCASSLLALAIIKASKKWEILKYLY